MADDALIRRHNLNRLGKSPTELTAILGKTPAYWSNLLRDPKKSFGEKSARRIEEAWPLPRGWLDEVHPSNTQIPSPGQGVAQDVSQARPTLSLPKVAWEDLKMGLIPTDPFELDVIDDALAPDIFTGCIAMMDPGRAPEPAWPVLVRDKNGGVYLRDYEAGPGATWRAVARARGFRAMDSEADGLVILAAMEGYRRPRKSPPGLP